MSTPKPVHYITRKQAAELVEVIRKARARGFPMPGPVLQWLQRNEVSDLTSCPSEAHSNPHTDSCPVCAPRWGLVGQDVRVR